MRLQLRRDTLEAATGVFAERGFHGTSMADIARAVGTGNSAIYSQFVGKQQLFDAVVDEALQRLASRLSPAPTPAASTPEELRSELYAIADRAADAFAEDRATLRLVSALLLEPTSGTGQGGDRAGQVLAVAAAITGTYLGGAADKGLLRSGTDVDALAGVVNAMLIGVMVQITVAGASKEDTRKMARAAVELYVEGALLPPS